MPSTLSYVKMHSHFKEFIMKNTGILKTDVLEANHIETITVSSGNIFIGKVFSHFRKLILLTILAGTGLFFNACSTNGYVTSEPAYYEHPRPHRPSEVHVWIDGDWQYNRTSRVYVKNSGSWQQPRPNHTYVAGQWQTAPKGKYYTKGHWQKNGQQNHGQRKKHNSH
jgi:hypothetical protein